MQEPPVPLARATTDPTAIVGGCLCGGLRYRLAALPTDVGHCHCRICQRSAGAAFVTWATVPRSELALTSGTPRWVRSSAAARRGFCPDCGTPLFFAADPLEPPLPDTPPAPGLATIDVTVVSLDEPDRCRPTRNIWVGTRRAFLHGFDPDLPDHLDEGPDPELG